MVGLERRTARGGRDSVDRRHGAHDDVANCVAGALVAASQVYDCEVVGSDLPFRPPVRLSDQTVRRVLGGWRE